MKQISVLEVIHIWLYLSILNKYIYIYIYYSKDMKWSIYKYKTLDLTLKYIYMFAMHVMSDVPMNYIFRITIGTLDKIIWIWQKHIYCYMSSKHPIIERIPVDKCSKICTHQSEVAITRCKCYRNISLKIWSELAKFWIPSWMWPLFHNYLI